MTPRRQAGTTPLSHMLGNEENFILIPEVEFALAKLFDQYNRLKSPGDYYAYGGQPFAVFYPGMEKFIPTMSLICLAAILDDALAEYIGAKNLGSASCFSDRINKLNNLGLLKDAQRLHDLRELRNSCAHEPDRFISWSEFEGSFSDAKAELSHLGIVA